MLERFQKVPSSLPLFSASLSQFTGLEISLFQDEEIISAGWSAIDRNLKQTQSLAECIHAILITVTDRFAIDQFKMNQNLNILLHYIHLPHAHIQKDNIGQT